MLLSGTDLNVLYREHGAAGNLDVLEVLGPSDDILPAVAAALGVSPASAKGSTAQRTRHAQQHGRQPQQRSESDAQTLMSSDAGADADSTCELRECKKLHLDFILMLRIFCTSAVRLICCRVFCYV